VHQGHGERGIRITRSDEWDEGFSPLPFQRLEGSCDAGHLKTGKQ
jgi:hypothetical protein